MRQTLKRIVGSRITRGIRHLGTRKSRNPVLYKSLLAGRRALEIGGPSEIFTYDGAVPVYPILRSVDNCLFGRETMWTGIVAESFIYDAQRRRGMQFVCEATKLEPIAEAAYECILASHCLEHSANPLRALAEFRRVLKPSGMVLVVLPRKDGTFDWRRPLTPLSHIIEDYKKDTGEDDLTHLSEVLALHDITRDHAAGTMEDFRERCLRNRSVRGIHHHTFDTASAVAMIEWAGYRVLQVETIEPIDIVILAQLTCNESASRGLPLQGV